MTRAHEAMKGGDRQRLAERPDMLVDMDAIMRLMDYDAMRSSKDGC